MQIKDNPNILILNRMGIPIQGFSPLGTPPTIIKLCGLPYADSFDEVCRYRIHELHTEPGSFFYYAPLVAEVEKRSKQFGKQN